VNGQFCPQVEHKLRTAAGEEVWRAAARPAAWVHVGMSATCLGVDFDHVIARAARFAPNADVQVLDRLTAALERGAMRAMATRRGEAKAAQTETIDLSALTGGVPSQ
jgi:hypothetical protein